MVLIIHPIDQSVAAILERERKVTIKEAWILDAITKSGITVSEDFKNEHKTGWRIYPSDDEVIFAKAFEQFYFHLGLKQQGYTCREANEKDNLSDDDLTNAIFA